MKDLQLGMEVVGRLECEESRNMDGVISWTPANISFLSLSVDYIDNVTHSNLLQQPEEI